MKINKFTFLDILIYIWAIRSFSFALYYLDGHRVYWQDPLKKNRFYYDFNGDSIVDAMDILLDNGRSLLRAISGAIYQKKVRIRKTIQAFFMNIKKNWKFLEH